MQVSDRWICDPYIRSRCSPCFLWNPYARRLATLEYSLQGCCSPCFLWNPYARAKLLKTGGYHNDLLQSLFFCGTLMQEFLSRLKGKDCLWLQSLFFVEPLCKLLNTCLYILFHLLLQSLFFVEPLCKSLSRLNTGYPAKLQSLFFVEPLCKHAHS